MSAPLPPSSPLSRRRFLQASAAALSGLSLSGCGWTLAEVHPVQKKPVTGDQLHIYTWSNYVDDALLEGFTAQTGIKVIADIFDSNETMLATFQAGKGRIYSVIYPSDYSVTKMVQMKLLQSLDHSRLMGLENILPKFQKSVHDSGNLYSIPVSWGTTGFIYNSEKLSPSPQDWSYLWNNQSQLSRRFTLLNDVREVMGGVLKSLGHSYNSTDPQEIRQAYEKLTLLKPAIATFTTDAWRDQLVAGDLLLSMGYSVDAMLVAQQDAKFKYVIPESGTSLWSDTMVIPKTAPNPDAAYAWINYMLQPAVAAQVTQRLLFATPNKAAYDQLPAPLRDNPTLFPPESLLEKSEGIAPVNQTITELYDKFWTQLTSS
ncbi:extracellular solute-binding protein [Kovacikia minuta CCNUW1]|uniref:ABC transporter substrate-binding protein n=1 Tax=Kovacikia minuta TaxID=2931930 RepID=UPI001CD034B4|nr:extracellular solute-binding protein [Kovacikia minuta]UBF24141.1 extracellular solute-binding protein [Kovacikia minuta CCNUW1]